MTRKKAELAELGLVNKWDAALAARQQIAELQALVTQIDAQIKDSVGDAEEITRYGVPVALYQKKKAWAWSKFAAENEVLAEAYTVEVTKRELDREALLRDHPTLLEEFQTREYRLVSGKGTPT